MNSFESNAILLEESDAMTGAGAEYMAGDLFVDDWSIEDTLGEGAFGEVKLLVNHKSGQSVAMKVMDLRNHSSHNKSLVRKEICVHRLLKAPNIVGYYGDRRDGDCVYIFLEYAPGGALYDHIDSFFGMSCYEAQKYFRELLAGMEYMHSVGIAHRDIKPENLLLDANDTLKICDFGLATKFRHMGQERILDSRCGTLQYIAPEVINRKYRGPPADIWSCGIVLVAMLVGDVPWPEAAMTCPEYKKWALRTTNVRDLPWRVLDTMQLSLVRNILTPNPEERFTIKQILKHRWMLQTFERVVHDSQSSVEGTPETSSTSICEDIYMENFIHTDGNSVVESEAEYEIHTRTCSSQPLARLEEEEESYIGGKFSFSQPTDVDTLFLSSQSDQSNQYPKFQNLVRRMTRFSVSTSIQETLETLRNYLEKARYGVKRNDATITITTKDRMQNPLVFRATALAMGNRTLLDFRLSKGCGLAFKRCFTNTKTSLVKIIVDEPVSWPVFGLPSSMEEN